LNTRIFESFEIFSPWFEVAASVGKLKVACSITSTMPCVCVCGNQTVINKTLNFFPQATLLQKA
jgi:hypothetical protein